MIIGVAGKAGAGKDTTADFLVKNHGFVKIALADPIKRAAMDWYGFSVTQLWGPSEERNKPDLRYVNGYEDTPDGASHPLYLTPRKALQFMGTEVGRELYPNTWVDYAMRIAKEILEEGVEYYPTRGTTVEKAEVPARGVVLSDVRFKNEIDAIHAAGGYVFRLTRGTSLSGAASQHRSETEQASLPDSLFDFLIENSGTLEELERFTATALAWVRNK
jgi:hypothetical protein